MPTETSTSRTLDVSLNVVAEVKEGWKVRTPSGGVAYVSSDYAVKLSPARVQPARFRLPIWLWNRLKAGD